MTNVRQLTFLDVLNVLNSGEAQVAEVPNCRGDCLPGGINAARPCPHSTCRYYVSEDKTCALDVADDGEHTLEEIGQKFGLTRERIRQIERNGLKKLRRRLEVMQLNAGSIRFEKLTGQVDSSPSRGGTDPRVPNIPAKVRPMTPGERVMNAILGRGQERLTGEQLSQKEADEEEAEIWAQKVWERRLAGLPLRIAMVI